MGSCKWGYTSPNMGYISIVTLLVTPLIATSEPPSGRHRNVVGAGDDGSREARLYCLGIGCPRGHQRHGTSSFCG